LIIGNLGFYPDLGRGRQAIGSFKPVSNSSRIEGKSEDR
jgi:hypothetical protein